MGMSYGCYNNSPELIEILKDKDIYKITAKGKIHLNAEGEAIKDD